MQLFSCVSSILKSRSESSFCSLGIALKNVLSIDLLPKKASVSREVLVFKKLFVSLSKMCNRKHMMDSLDVCTA